MIRAFTHIFTYLFVRVPLLALFSFLSGPAVIGNEGKKWNFDINQPSYKISENFYIPEKVQVKVTPGCTITIAKGTCSQGETAFGGVEIKVPQVIITDGTDSLPSRSPPPGSSARHVMLITRC